MGTARSTVGFVGLGVMGSRMVGRLLAAGNDVVIWTRTRANAGPLVEAGAHWADRPADVAAAADTVLGCLLDAAAVEAVHLAGGGLLEAARPGMLVAEHGTFDVTVARRVAAAWRERGAAFVDAPVTGGPDGAVAGQLSMMAGGEQGDVERLAAAAAAYCAHSWRVGPVGAGLQLKLVNQLLVGVHTAAAAEAAALLRELPIDPEVALEVLGSGWAASRMLDHVLPRALAGEHTDTGASIVNLLPTQRLAAELCVEHGLRPSVHAAASELMTRAVALPHGGHRDLSALVDVVVRSPTPETR